MNWASVRRWFGKRQKRAQARVYLGLGSNVDPEKNLRLGILELRRRFGELDLSPVYRNAAVGFNGADFLNLVVGLSCHNSPIDIHTQIEEIHDLAGRKRDSVKFSSRPLDIDLLLYDDLVIADPPLRVPRSDILEHDFVLRPLAELAPDLVHPETGRTIATHWQSFDAEPHLLTPVSDIL